MPKKPATNPDDPARIPPMPPDARDVRFQRGEPDRTQRDVAAARETLAAGKAGKRPLADPADLLTPDELCARWRGAVTTKTLANWRNAGEGPPAVRIGRQAFYRLADVLAYEERQAETDERGRRG